MLRDITEEQKQIIERKYDHIIEKVRVERGEAYVSGAIRACIAADFLSDALNELNFDNDTFAKAMVCDHRTLIQNKFRGLMAFCDELRYLHRAGAYDARNEDSCRAASVVMEALEAANLTHVRTI